MINRKNAKKSNKYGADDEIANTSSLTSEAAKGNSIAKNALGLDTMMSSA